MQIRKPFVKRTTSRFLYACAELRRCWIVGSSKSSLSKNFPLATKPFYLRKFLMDRGTDHRGLGACLVPLYLNCNVISFRRDCHFSIFLIRIGIVLWALPAHSSR